MTEEFHLGHLIREELDRQNLTVVWFAEAIKQRPFKLLRHL